VARVGVLARRALRGLGRTEIVNGSQPTADVYIMPVQGATRVDVTIDPNHWDSPPDGGPAARSGRYAAQSGPCPERRRVRGEPV